MVKQTVSRACAALVLLTGSAFAGPCLAGPWMAGEPIVRSTFGRQLGAGESGRDVLVALADGDRGVVVRCAVVLTMDAMDTTHRPGMIASKNGELVYVGAPIEIPACYEVRDHPDSWAWPGLIDLHSHVQTGGWGDINDMVVPINAEFSTRPTIRPHNPNIRRATAAGVTTLFGIPGSGTSMSGFGVLYKTRTSGTYEGCVLADPGGLKVAQTHNPERRGGDLGASRAGLGWILEDAADKALAAAEQGRFDPQYENLSKVMTGELPVLIHCAAAQGVAATVRMWKHRYNTRCVVSHGSFNGWKAAAYVAEAGVPVNHGPRTMDYWSTREGRIVGTGHEYVKAGVPNFSLNTDAGVMPQEEFFLQGAMTARLGADGTQMVRALTIHPAASFGIDDRVGSLEPGKHADVVVGSGDPLDPRSRVELVLIQGSIQYDIAHDGQWF